MRSFIRVVLVSHSRVLGYPSASYPVRLRICLDRLRAERPDHLIFAGNQINANLVNVGEGRYSNARTARVGDFAASMWQSYQLLLASPAMQQLRQSASQVHALWDDADLAWPGACGGVQAAGDAEPTPTSLIPADKRVLARGLFDAFVRAWREGKQTLEPLDIPMWLDLRDHWQGVQSQISLDLGHWQVVLHLSDCCWYRGRPQAFDGVLLGETQRASLRGALRRATRHKQCLVLVSPRTLMGAHHAWQHWGADFALLRRAVFRYAHIPHEPGSTAHLLFAAPRPGRGAGQLLQTMGLCQTEFATLQDYNPGYLALDFGTEGVTARFCHADGQQDRHYLLSYAHWQASEFVA